MSGDTHQIRLSQVPASMLKFDHTTKRKTPCTSDGVSKFQVIYQGWPITWNLITTLSLTPIDRSQKQHNGSTKYEFDVRWYKHQVLFIWKETYLYSTHSSTRIIPRMLKMWFLITPASQPDPRGRHSSHVHTHTHTNTKTNNYLHTHKQLRHNSLWMLGSLLTVLFQREWYQGKDNRGIKRSGIVLWLWLMWREWQRGEWLKLKSSHLMSNSVGCERCSW